MNIESNAEINKISMGTEVETNITGFGNVGTPVEPCVEAGTSYEDNDGDFDHIETVLEGYGEFLSKEELDEGLVSGNEAYAMSVLQIYGYESWMDSIKKGAESAYNAIIATLKKLKDFFFGDGEKRVEEADKKASESLVAMSKLDLNAPVKDEATAKNPLTFFKGIQESAELEKVYEKYPGVKTAFEKIEASVSRVKNSETVGQLGAVFQDMRKSASAAGSVISSSLKKALDSAEKKANEIRNPKGVPDDATAEMKAAVKEEHKETVAEAREETKESRILASLQNKITTMLNAISSNASSVKGETKESEFKG